MKHILIAIALIVLTMGLCTAHFDYSYSVEGVGTFSDTGDTQKPGSYSYNPVIYRRLKT